jgi:PAS domain S-box-containing protein
LTKSSFFDGKYKNGCDRILPTMVREAEMKNAKSDVVEPRRTRVARIKDPAQSAKNQQTEPTLRKRAENKVAANSGVRPLSPTDSLKLVHELQVHQVELEMQNEELQSGRTEIEDSRARFSDLYDFSPVGYVTLDDKGLVLEANRTIVRLMGFEKDSLLQKPFHSFVFSEDKRFFLEFFHHLIPLNAKTTVEIRITKKDNSIFNAQVETIGFKTSDKSSQQYLLAILDITDRTEAERLLRIRSEELTFANKELEAFSYSVSHDLRNPLNSMVACLSVLKENLETMGTDSKEAVGHMVNSTKRMSHVITDLLALSGVARQEVHREHINISDMARSFYAELKSSDPHREVSFVIASDCIVNADAGLVRILLENLVRNAWKYTSKTGRAHIEFGKQQDKRPITYFIRDNGVGFDMNDVDKLFKPFVRLHSEKDFKGTGIGLAIAKRIIDKHHGAIWAQAEVEKGATFFFRLE